MSSRAKDLNPRLGAMNRHDRRAERAKQHKFVERLSDTLIPVPPDQIPAVDPFPVQAWVSKRYFVQLYEEHHPTLRLVRLSVCRAKIKTDGHWEDRLTWDDLMAIKREVGFGDWYGMEIYPPDQDVINVANMRHLWLAPDRLNIGWRKE